MKYALALLLSFFSATAFAAGGGDVGGFVNFVIYLIVAGVIFGILLWLVAKAPFIPAEGKTIINYVLYFVAALFVINLLLSLIGHPIFSLN